jgi:hypothetical protein
MSLMYGIVELRQKGASDRLSRELLASVKVAISTDMIVHFSPRSLISRGRDEHRPDPADVLDHACSGELGVNARKVLVENQPLSG